MTFRPTYRRVHILPSLLTLGNFACGFFSIVFCLNALYFASRAQTLSPGEQTGVRGIEVGAPADIRKRDAEFRNSAVGLMERSSYLLQWACVILFLGMAFDMLDGRVARLMGASSAFGRELDSLADVITSGIAPPIIVNTLWITVMPAATSWWGQVLVFGFIFAACAMLRLARYNIQDGTEDKNVFSGLPTPAAAGCVVTAVMVAYGDYPLIERVCSYLDALIGPSMNAFQVKVNLLALYQIIPALLMVSSVPFVHVANRYLSGKKSFALLVVAVIMLGLFWQDPRLFMFFCFNGYMAWSLIAYARRKWWGKTNDPVFSVVDAVAEGGDSRPDADTVSDKPEPDEKA